MHFDTLIVGGTVIDGSQGPGARTDQAAVGIKAGKIAAIGPMPDFLGATADHVMDAQGQVVAPGFIDVHVHSEIALIAGDEIQRYGNVRQGVTTHLLAPDGFGWAGLSPEKAREMWRYTLFVHGEADLFLDWPTPQDFLAIFSGRTPANVVPQAPHCAIRLGAMGWSANPADDDAIQRMREQTRAWMEAGAVGLALGLDYQPSACSDTRELIELCRVVAEYGGIAAAHIRYNGLGTPGAWREAIEIAEKAGIPFHVSHEFVTDETEPLLEEAAIRCDLTFESYLYPAGCTHLALTLPLWAQSGGHRQLRARLKDPSTRSAIAESLRGRLKERLEEGGNLVFADTPSGRYIGMGIGEAAAAEGMDLGDFAVRILEEEDPYALMIYHHPGDARAHEEKARRTLRHPRMMLASDGIYHGARPHPRAYGCFAAALRLGVRELGDSSLETCIHKMTGFPAERFGIEGRGRLRPGFGADLVIFDPEKVADRATWEEPRRSPVGVNRVMVNGQWVVVDDSPTGALPGVVLRR